MTPEPPRSIEQLLHALARRRREAARGEQPLTPVTRRLLQAEVARQFPRPQPEPATGPWQALKEWLSSGWGRWASVGIVLVTAGAAAFSLLRPDGWLQSRAGQPAKRPSGPPLSPGRITESPGSVALGITDRGPFSRGPAPAGGPRTVEMRPAPVESGSATSLPARGNSTGASRRTTTVARSDAPAAPAPARSRSAAPPAATGLPAPTSVAPSVRSVGVDPSRPPAGAADASRETQLGFGGIEGPALGGRASTGPEGRGGQAPEPTLWFMASREPAVRAVPEDAPLPKAAAGGTTPADLLTRFEVQRQGDVVRLIDLDGSHYLGRLKLPETPPAEVITAPAAKGSESATGGPTSTRVWQVQLRGTNRSLGQPVEVSGWLTETSHNVVTNGSMSTGAVPDLNRPLPVLPSAAKVPVLPVTPTASPGTPGYRISGQMRVGKAPAETFEATGRR